MSKKSQYNEIGPYLNLLLKLGITMCLTIACGFGVGFALEKKFPTSGLFLILGTLSGVGAGFYMMYNELKKLNINDPNNTKNTTK